MQFSRTHNRAYVPSLEQQFRSSHAVPANIPSSPSFGFRKIRTLGFTPGPQLSVQGMRQGQVGSGGFRGANYPTTATASASSAPSITPSDGKKMRWGAPTWTFFHTFAAQIHPTFFAEHREEIMQMLLTIASTLPCPICAQHAQEHLARMGFLTRVQTQLQLKHFFYHFHNTVNQRKGYAIYSYDDLQRYDTANFPMICQHFLFHYRDKSRQTKLIADDLQRLVLAKRIEAWLRTHLTSAFAPRVSSPTPPAVSPSSPSQ